MPTDPTAPRAPRRGVAPAPDGASPVARAVALATILAATLGGVPTPAAAADGLVRDPFDVSGRLDALITDAGALRDCDAAGAVPSPLALGDAVDLALCRNPATRSAWAVARQQAAAFGAARGAWLPQVDASGGVTWVKGTRLGSGSSGSSGSTGSTAGLGTLGDRTRRTEDAALGLSWTLFDFGGRQARETSAARALDAAAATLGRESQQVVYATVQAYFGVVAADAALDAAREAERASARSLEVARARLDAGVATRADLLQAETANGQSVLARVQAEGGAATSRGQLAVTIGSPADRRFELAPRAVPDDVPALATRVADLLAAAETQRPDLAAARAQRAAADADVAAARAAGRPTISLGAQRGWTEIAGLPSQDSRSVGLNVAWPLFSGFQTTYRVRQAEAARDARDADVERIRLQVSLDVWTAHATLASAGQQLAATATLLASARENERVALGRYEAGVGTIVDVVTAQSALANARQQRIAAERAWQVARAELALATGRLANATPLVAPPGAATAGETP